MSSSASVPLAASLCVSALALTSLTASAQPPIPTVPSERWIFWYYDAEGWQTLDESVSTWTQGVVRDKDGRADLALDCAGQASGVGYNVTLQRPSRPQGPFEGADTEITLGVIVVGGRGYGAQSLYETMIGPVAFQGYGPHNEGGYTFGAEPALIDALKAGNSVTLVTEEAGNMTFSLSGSTRVINTLGCE